MNPFQLPKHDHGCWNLPKCFLMYAILNEVVVYYSTWNVAV